MTIEEARKRGVGNGVCTEGELADLDELLERFRAAYPRMPIVTVVQSDDPLENAGKMIQALHPEGPSEHWIVLVEPENFVPQGNPDDPNSDWAKGMRTLCTTGNSPNSQNHALLVAYALWLLPDLLKNARMLRGVLPAYTAALGVAQMAQEAYAQDDLSTWFEAKDGELKCRIEHLEQELTALHERNK